MVGQCYQWIVFVVVDLGSIFVDGGVVDVDCVYLVVDFVVCFEYCDFVVVMLQNLCCGEFCGFCVDDEYVFGIVVC